MPALKLPFSIVALCFLLSACSTSSTKPAMEASVRAEAPELPVHWKQGTDSEKVQVGWIHSFNDQTLIKLVEEAQANNQDLRAAAANVERALALAAQAGSALSPSVNVALGGGRSGGVRSTTPESSNQSVNLQASWEADIWGRISAGSKAADASAQAAKADYRFAQHSLAANTTKAYLIAIETKLQAKVVMRRLASLKETLRIVQVRYNNGLVSAQDLALARSDRASVREQLATLEGGERDAIRALEILLGRYPGAELALRDSLPSVPAAPPLGVPSELLERRPDLVVAERRVAAAFNRLEEAKAARLPSLSLTSNIGSSSASLSEVLNPQNAIWQLGANLLAPVFDGGRRQAQVEIVTAEQKQTLANYGKTALDAFGQVEKALDHGSVLATRENELNTAKTQANAAYQIAKLRYQEGEIALLDLLALQQRVDGATSNLLVVQRLLLEQRVNLHLALGGDWDTH